jgi:hypothetical protein
MCLSWTRLATKCPSASEDSVHRVKKMSLVSRRVITVTLLVNLHSTGLTYTLHSHGSKHERVSHREIEALRQGSSTYADGIDANQSASADTSSCATSREPRTLSFQLTAMERCCIQSPTALLALNRFKEPRGRDARSARRMSHAQPFACAMPPVLLQSFPR